MHRATSVQSAIRGAPTSQPVPRAEFEGLETLWIQVTGTLCNLRCTHCFISCSPDNHTLEFMSREQIVGYLREAADLGVKELYFTGGEPFLHREIFEVLGDSLRIAPTTVLTNGVLITERFARRLGELAADSPYSLEIRVSLDAPEEAANDAIRGPGVFRRALTGLRRLQAVGLLPIVTATELVVEDAGNELVSDQGAGTGNDAETRPKTAIDSDKRLPLPRGVDPSSLPGAPGAGGFYQRFRSMLEEAGLERARVKILPVFNMGMLEGRGEAVTLTERMLEGFDTGTLQCSASRLAADDGVYACPILAGEPAARMSTNGLAAALGPCSLYHPSCTTCYLTGMSCRNY